MLLSMMLAACAPSSAVLHPLDIPATPPTHNPDEATATGCDTLWSSERAFIAQNTTTLEERAACEAVVHPIAGARGATLQVTLTAWGGLAPAQLQVTDLLDARYLAVHLDPDASVAFVVTIGTPHRGTPVADAAVGLLDISWLGAVTAELLVDSLGLLLGAGSDQELIEQLRDLSTASQADFNAEVPDRGDVYYASWAGRTCGLLDLYCIAETGGEVVDPLLVAPLLLLSVVSGDSDGIVPVSSAQWGDYRGEISADHIEQVATCSARPPRASTTSPSTARRLCGSRRRAAEYRSGSG
jgi:hypothetical protein